jgi:hypothetical protein
VTQYDAFIENTQVTMRRAVSAPVVARAKKR